MWTTCVETRPNQTLLFSVYLIFICLSISQFYLKCLFTFVTWSCRHLADSSWCSPSGKGRRRRFCRPSVRSLRSQSLWHHFLDTAGRWGNPRRTALAAPNRKAGRLCWTLGVEVGGWVTEIWKRSVEIKGSRVKVSVQLQKMKDMKNMMLEGR